MDMPLIKEIKGKLKITCTPDGWDMQRVGSDVLAVKYEVVCSSMGSDSRREIAETMLDIFRVILQNNGVDDLAVSGKSLFNTTFANARKSIVECNNAVLPKPIKISFSIRLYTIYARPDKDPKVGIKVEGGKGRKEFRIPLKRITVAGPTDFSTNLDSSRVDDWNKELLALISANNMFS